MPITLNGSTSGQVTIDAPAVAGTTTITLPSTTGNILTDQSSLASAKLTGALPAIDGSALTGISSYSDADALSLFNASGSAPVYACRAWVNFNGTGTVAIRSSGNVSSITDNGTGDYTVNFTTLMPDADYSVGGGIQCETGIAVDRFFTLRGNVTPSTSSYSFRVINGSNITVDCPRVFQHIFR